MGAPQDPEERFTIQTSDGLEVGVGRENCALYTFIGDAALYDHIYITKIEGDSNKALYIFEWLLPIEYTKIKEKIEDKKYKQILNNLQPESCDVDAFSKAAQTVIDADVRRFLGE